MVFKNELISKFREIVLAILRSIGRLALRILPVDFFSWKRWSSRQRFNFALNVFWGIVVVIVLHFAQYTSIGQTAINDAYDFLVMKDFQQAIARSTEKNISPISDKIRLVVLDRETYDASPSRGFWTPRELLGRCIVKAIQLGAKVVVVDFAIDRPMPIYCEQGNCVDENEIFLNLLSTAIKVARKQGSVIILPWTGEKPSTDSYTRHLSRMLVENNDVLKLGSPEVFRDPSDYQVRHFGFYEPVGEDGNLLFSIHILSSIYLWYGESDGDRIIRDAEKKVRNGGHQLVIPAPRGSRGSDLKIYAHTKERHGGAAARYIFRLAPRELTKEICIECEDPLLKYHDLMITPAVLLDKDAKKARSYEGKAVLIGSTNPDMGDLHPTPLGEMSGVFLIANGINLILEKLQIHEPSLLLRILIESVIIYFVAVFFMQLSSFFAAAVLIMFLLIATTPISVLLFSKYGLFIDFWLPILGIGIHQNIADAEESVKEWWKKRKEKAA